MINSKFFIQQFDKNDDSIVDIFRYKILNNSKEKSLDRKYPIYVTLKDNSIEFSYQGNIKISPVVNTESFSYFYSQVPILVIPFQETTDEKTTQEVIKIYNRNFHVKPFLQTDADGLKGKSNDSSILNSFYQYSELSEVFNDISYSKLEIFGIKDFNWNAIEWNEKKDCKHRNRFLRKLLLEFFDDFFNANVFLLSPKYFKIKEKILNSSILKGIYLKADFYSKQEQFENLKRDELIEELYFNALDKWTEFIVHDKHKYLFAVDKKIAKPSAWFDYADDELLMVIRNKTFIEISKEKDVTDKIIKKKQAIKKRGFNYLIQNYEIFDSFELLISDSKLKFFAYFSILFFVFAFYFYFKIDNSFLFPSTIIVLLSLYFFVLFSHSKKLKLESQLPKFSHRMKIWVLNYSFLFIVVTLLIVVCVIIYKLNTWSWLIICISIPIIIITGLLICVYARKFSASINLLLPRLLATITTSWIAVFSSLDYLKKSFTLSPYEAIAYGFTLTIVTSFFLLYEVRRNTLITNRVRIFRKIINVIIPGYFLSMTIGIIGTFFILEPQLTSSDFFETKYPVRENIFELRQHDSIATMWKDSIDVLKNELLVTYDVNKIKDKKACLEDAIASLKTENGNDFFYNHKSIRDHLNGLHLISNDQSSSPNNVAYIYPNPPKSYAIFIFPGFLILMSAFALFSGIFLTLLFDSKPVTDPL